MQCGLSDAVASEHASEGPKDTPGAVKQTSGRRHRLNKAAIPTFLREEGAQKWDTYVIW
jgi:hypothetical protein